jgi:hypothetical protein
VDESFGAAQGQCLSTMTCAAYVLVFQRESMVHWTCAFVLQIYVDLSICRSQCCPCRCVFVLAAPGRGFLQDFCAASLEVYSIVHEGSFRLVSIWFEEGMFVSVISIQVRMP